MLLESKNNEDKESLHVQNRVRSNSVRVICAYTHMCVCLLRACMCVHVCVCACACVHVCVRAYSYVSVPMHVHVCVHACVYSYQMVGTCRIIAEIHAYNNHYI